MILSYIFHSKMGKNYFYIIGKGPVPIGTGYVKQTPLKKGKKRWTMLVMSPRGSHLFAKNFETFKMQKLLL